MAAVVIVVLAIPLVLLFWYVMYLILDWAGFFSPVVKDLGELKLMVRAYDEYKRNGVDIDVTYSGVTKKISACGDINKWKVRDITDMSELFRDMTEFNHDIGRWDVSNVANMKGMFWNARRFNQDIGRWDVSNTTNMACMFRGATDFNQFLNDWEVSNVTNMRGMFMDASSFAYSVSNWDVRQVRDMAGMFKRAVSFNQYLNDWKLDTIMFLDRMFEGAETYNMSLNNWAKYLGYDTNLVSVDAMFWNARNFNQNLSTWKISGQWYFEGAGRDVEISDMMYNTKTPKNQRPAIVGGVKIAYAKNIIEKPSCKLGNDYCTIGR